MLSNQTQLVTAIRIPNARDFFQDILGTTFGQGEQLLGNKTLARCICLNLTWRVFWTSKALRILAQSLVGIVSVGHNSRAVLGDADGCHSRQYGLRQGRE